MNREERQKIYFLLSQFYENSKQLKNPAKRTAWGLVLENYTYEDVKAKVLEYAARNKFFPDISDITADLPVISQPSEDGPTEPSVGPLPVEWTESVEQYKHRETASGGPCQIRKLWPVDNESGEAMIEGLFWRRHYPEDCVGCRRKQMGGACPAWPILRHIEQEQEACLILRAHRGEAHQKELLSKYWRELCPLCGMDSCFWLKGMHMIEEDTT